MSDIIPVFTYSVLPDPIAAEVMAATERIKVRIARTVTDILDTGSDLQEVKDKLQHGQFEPWLNTSFNMTTRTAQKYMRAAEWLADKSELSSHLTPNTIYLLSAPSTPEAAQHQVLDDLGAGKPIDHRQVVEVVNEAKYQKRQEKTAEQRRLDRERRKRSNARREREQRKEEEERQRRTAAATVIVRRVAGILVAKLREDEVTEIYKALGNFEITYEIWRTAIATARQPHSDNVTVLPPKPWGPK